jgi:hypothetical protein
LEIAAEEVQDIKAVSRSATKFYAFGLQNFETGVLLVVPEGINGASIEFSVVFPLSGTETILPIGVKSLSDESTLFAMLTTEALRFGTQYTKPISFGI